MVSETRQLSVETFHLRPYPISDGRPGKTPVHQTIEVDGVQLFLPPPETQFGVRDPVDARTGSDPRDEGTPCRLYSFRPQHLSQETLLRHWTRPKQVSVTSTDGGSLTGERCLPV